MDEVKKAAKNITIKNNNNTAGVSGGMKYTIVNAADQQKKIRMSIGRKLWRNLIFVFVAIERFAVTNFLSENFNFRKLYILPLTLLRFVLRIFMFYLLIVIGQLVMSFGT